MNVLTMNTFIKFQNIWTYFFILNKVYVNNVEKKLKLKLTFKAVYVVDCGLWQCILAKKLEYLFKIIYFV